MALRVITLTNSQLITRSDPFLIWMNHWESLINGVTCWPCCFSNNTGPAGIGGWGGERRIRKKKSSAVSERRTAQRLEPSLSRVICPVIIPLAWRSRCKRNSDTKINHIQIWSLGNIRLELWRSFLLFSSGWCLVLSYIFGCYRKHPSHLMVSHWCARWCRLKPQVSNVQYSVYYMFLQCIVSESHLRGCWLQI